MLMMLALLYVCSLPQRTERLMLMMLALGGWLHMQLVATPQSG